MCPVENTDIEESIYLPVHLHFILSFEKLSIEDSYVCNEFLPFLPLFSMWYHKATFH